MLRRTVVVRLALVAALVAGPRPARAGDPPPVASAPPTAPTARAPALGTPAPAVPRGGESPAVGLLSLTGSGTTLAGLRSDGRMFVREGDASRLVEAPKGGEAWRVHAIAGDGVVVAVTTRGRIALLERTGERFLPFSVQRSAKPAGIPGSIDVVLGSENGAIQRLVRTGAEPRLVEVVASGDAPVGALAASTDRVVYARLDGVVLGVRLDGGGPTPIARLPRAVRWLAFVGAVPHAAVGGGWFAIEGRSGAAGAACADDAVGIDAVAVSPDGAFVATLAGGGVEARRSADGAGVRSDALRARRPTGLAWSADGRTLLAATATDEFPVAWPFDRGGPSER